MASNTWCGTLRFREKDGHETHITELRTSGADGFVPDLPLSLLVYHSHLLSLRVVNQHGSQQCELICCEPARAKTWTGFLKHLRSANKAARTVLTCQVLRCGSNRLAETKKQLSAFGNHWIQRTSSHCHRSSIAQSWRVPQSMVKTSR